MRFGSAWLCVLMLACGGGDGNGGEVVVESDDGMATLTIPDGAFPEGVDASDIVITPVSVTADGATVVAAYDLEPSGTVFRSPIEMRIVAPDPSRIVSIVHLSESSAEGVATEIEEEAGTSHYVFPLAHFSRVLVAEFGIMRTTLDENRRAFIGGLISASFMNEILRPSGSVTIDRGPGGGSYGARIRWQDVDTTGWHHTVRGHQEISSSVLDEFAVQRLADQTGTVAWLAPQPFTCVEAGEVLLVWSASARFRALYEHLSPAGGTVWERENNLIPSTWFDPVTVECLEPGADTGSILDSISTETPGYQSPVIDIESHGVQEQSITQQYADAVQNTTLAECSSEHIPGAVIVCGTDQQPLGAGRLLTATMNLAENVPIASPDRSFIYSLVIDSDGQPANNWVFNPPFDWDLFQSTDRWYQLAWDHRTQEWTLTVTQVGSDQSTRVVQSGAWAVIQDNHINFYVPGTEYTSGQVSYRMTAFGHDGNFTQGDRGADVTGTDPTEPPIPVPAQ